MLLRLIVLPFSPRIQYVVVFQAAILASIGMKISVSTLPVNKCRKAHYWLARRVLFQMCSRERRKKLYSGLVLGAFILS